MSGRRIVGLILVVFGLVALAWGGVFWTDRDTLVDAGPIEIASEEREGFVLPPVVGVLAVIGGIVLLAVPERRRT
jgi:drug/metabolite transporter (DMT)-like permease